MPVISKSLTDALKQVLQSLQIPFILPAAVLVVTSLLLFPYETNFDATTGTTFGIAATVLISYLLYACNIPIIRLAEGYILEESWFFWVTHKFEDWRYRSLTKEVAKCDEKIRKLKLLRTTLFLYLGEPLPKEWEQKIKEASTDWTNRKRAMRERLELRFPSVRSKPLPTSLGNTIAAFEDYPWTRYCMDAVHLWPRMLPILEERKFMPFLQNEKAVFDFLLNSGLILVGICFELLLLFGLYKPDMSYLVVIVVLLVMAYLLYLGAVIAAQHWGGMVRVAFDLYRNDLRQALYLPDIPDESLKEEKKLWATISSFLVFNNTSEFNGFIYSRPKGESEKEKPCAAAND